MHSEAERRASGRQCATCDYRFTFMHSQPTQCRACSGQDHPTPYPAIEVTPAGPAYLLPGLTPTDETKGDATQRRMF